MTDEEEEDDDDDDVRERNEYLSLYGFRSQQGITCRNDIQAQPLGTRK
jgi:hypothetical protein